MGSTTYLPDWLVNSYPAEHEMLYLITRPAFDAVVRQPIKQSGIADKALTNISISLERTGSRMDIKQKKKDNA